METIKKNWDIKKPSPELVQEIVTRLKISRPAAAVLVNRGVSSVREAAGFLAPNLADLENPFLLPDIIPAVNRIRRALDKKEKILVYGDRDVDGISSISVMVRTLKSLGAQPLWFIPSDEGYGVHKEVLDRYVPQGVTLVITVDCGISAHEETLHAAAQGIDFVITDHHEQQPNGIPQAVAVVDPKREDSRYPFTDLAGCTVAMKVAEALMLSFGKYYDKEISSFEIGQRSGGGREIGVVRMKNGIVRDSLVPASESDLAALLGDSLLVTRIPGPCREVLARLKKNNTIIDINEEYRRAFPERDPGDMAAHLGMDISEEQSDARERAAASADLFYRSERLADLRMKFFREAHLDTVTLGTIADIMPLVRENRILVKEGLKTLPQSRKAGIKALLAECVRQQQKGGGLSAKSVSWGITPLLNAAGRRGKAGLAAELLLTDDEHRAWQLLREISQLNTERKELQAENLDKFMPLLEAQCDMEHDKAFLVTATGVEHGVTGIIASRIARTYHRPTILLIVEGNEAMGAARSIEGYDLMSMFGQVSDLFTKYGGHSQAAGLTIAVDKLDELRRRIREIAAREIPDTLLVQRIDIDSEIESSEICAALLHELEGLEPCGTGNPYPIFSLRGMKVLDRTLVGARGDHLKLKLAKDGGAGLSAIGWSMGHLNDSLSTCPYLDLAVQLEFNEWQDRKQIQLLIVDIRPSQ